MEKEWGMAEVISMVKLTWGRVHHGYHFRSRAYETRERVGLVKNRRMHKQRTHKINKRNSRETISRICAKSEQK